MAIIDLSATTSYPLIKYAATVGTTQQEVTLPAGKLKLTVGGDAACFIATSGVSDGAAMPTDKVSIPANNLLELELSHSASDRIETFAVAAQTGTANVQIILERA